MADSCSPPTAAKSAPVISEEAHEAEIQAQTTIEAGDNSEHEDAAAAAAAVGLATPGLGGSDSSSDAGYGSDAASRASTSLSSSVRDYSFENSRRYHKFQEGKYHFPNVEPEQEREDMKHAMIVNLCNGKLHYAPLDHPQKILDIGTGTGIWAVDMADEYPEADVLGVDLSPIQPSWVPPNVRFMVDDVEAEFIHAANTFDYVHIRHMTSSIRDWPRLLSQVYRVLKPGGYVEIQELRFVIGCDDGSLSADNGVVAWMTAIGDGLLKLGVNFLGMEENKSRIEKAEFGGVTEKAFKIPLGTWPRNPKMETIGLYQRTVLADGLHGISMGPLTRGLKWTPQQVEMFLVKVRKTLTDNSQHGYLPFHVLYGRKPVDG